MRDFRLLGILALLNLAWAPVNFAVVQARESFGTGAIIALRWPLFALGLWVLFALLGRREMGPTGPEANPQPGAPPLRDARAAAPGRPLFVMPNGILRIQALAIGFFLVGPAHALYTLGISGSSSSETAILNLTSPLFMACLAGVILRERVGPQRWLAILLSGLGAYWVSIGFRPPTLDGAHTAGNVTYLVGVLAESLAMILAMRIIRQSSGLGTLVWEVTGAGLATLILPLVLPGVLPLSVGEVTPLAVFSIAYLVLVAGLLCFGVWYIKAERAPITWMMLTLALQAPLSAFIGWRFNGEHIGVNVLAGLALILVALTVATIRRPSPQAAEE